MTASQPKKGGKRLLLILIGLIVAVLIAAGAYFGYKQLSPFPLATYESADLKFSILRPSDFEVEVDTQGVVTFNEKTDEEIDGDTQSSIIVTSEDIGLGLPSDQIFEFLELINEDEISEQFLDSNQAFTTEIKERRQISGHDGMYWSGHVKEDGQDVGEVVMLFIVTSNGRFYTVAVMAHSSDPGLQKSIDKIVDSFKTL